MFNTVFTTNFDDLINESCYLYSPDVRPIVCAHDSSIDSVRLTAKRAKIIKLHGDFLFDSIKNTVRELESLEANIRDKFRQFASEYGMIVVGYSGNDRSVMDTLEALLRNSGAFPHGIYWCVRRGGNGSLTPAVERLRRFPKFQLVEIDDFDSFRASLHGSLSSEAHPIIDDPYKMITSRFRRLLDSLQVPEGPLHAVIARDIRRLTESLEKQNQTTQVRLAPPYHLLAMVELKNGNVQEAFRLLRKELTEAPTIKAFVSTAQALSLHWDEALADLAMSALRKLAPFHKMPAGDLLNGTVHLIEAQQYDRAIEVTQLFDQWLGKGEESERAYYKAYNRLNYFQCRLRKSLPLSEEEKEEIRKIGLGASDMHTRFACLIVLGWFDRAAKMFRESKEPADSKMSVLAWPICDLLPVDLREELTAEVQSTIAQRKAQKRQNDSQQEKQTTSNGEVIEEPAKSELAEELPDSQSANGRIGELPGNEEPPEGREDE
ncbi:MAG: SIR2 family protein [Planctomycetaceae bacterium]|nr:SIR2 family protein [Planctomycetaceae bacterium]